MMIQVTMTKNESFLIKEMLPIWSKWVDGFVFYDDGSVDDTFDYLNSCKDQYNILSIIRGDVNYDPTIQCKVETDVRGKLCSEGYKFSNKLICLDTDEYLDGSINKEQLEQFIDQNPDTLMRLRWVQYTGDNTIRTDGPWKVNFKDRIGHYSSPPTFDYCHRHSLHVPSSKNDVYLNPDQIFLAHLQWLDKQWVGVKQYYWKVCDYVDKSKHNADVYPPTAYDASVANFQWDYEPFDYKLKIRSDIFSSQNIAENDKLEFIRKYTNLLNIPNLGDWGLGIYDYCLRHP
jgi:hypothetical protein